MWLSTVGLKFLYEDRKLKEWKREREEERETKTTS